eukprot:GEMP01055642.1.p1 GENE.GEMP01055642.1~~GEMP01055642.1.p1  ORF type:complete len:290 (+),score=48.64 GEMP01055642.1:121-990(+)
MEYSAIDFLNKMAPQDASDDLLNLDFFESSVSDLVNYINIEGNGIMSDLQNDPADIVNCTSVNINCNTELLNMSAPEVVTTMNATEPISFSMLPTDIFSDGDLLDWTPLTDVPYANPVETSPEVLSVPNTSIAEFSEIRAQTMTEMSPIQEVLNTEDEELMTTVSTKEILQLEPPKKRGRKRKPRDESAPPSRRRKQKKQKVYEIDTPFADQEQERKRKNAQNAKKHRDLQKQIRDELAEELQQVKTERDTLRLEVEDMRRREENLVRQLQIFQQQNNNILYPVMLVSE